MADTNERELAEQRYVGLAHDYESNPIGSRDWVIFWNGWRERSELKATPLPADAALIGKLRHQLAQATDEAARLRALSQPEVAQVPIEWRRTVRELMTLTNFRPLCQKNAMDGCRCYDCVMERAGAILDEQSSLSAAPSANGGAT